MTSYFGSGLLSRAQSPVFELDQLPLSEAQPDQGSLVMAQPVDMSALPAQGAYHVGVTRVVPTQEPTCAWAEVVQNAMQGYEDCSWLYDTGAPSGAGHALGVCLDNLFTPLSAGGEQEHVGGHALHAVTASEPAPVHQKRRRDNFKRMERPNPSKAVPTALLNVEPCACEVALSTPEGSHGLPEASPWTQIARMMSAPLTTGEALFPRGNVVERIDTSIVHKFALGWQAKCEAMTKTWQQRGGSCPWFEGSSDQRLGQARCLFMFLMDAMKAGVIRAKRVPRGSLDSFWGIKSFAIIERNRFFNGIFALMQQQGQGAVSRKTFYTMFRRNGFKVDEGTFGMLPDVFEYDASNFRAKKEIEVCKRWKGAA